MSSTYHIALRSSQAVFSVVVLALSSYVAFLQTQTGYHSAVQINFLIFAPAFSIFSLLFLELAPRFSPKASNQYVALGLQGINSVLYFCGFIALSVFLGRLMYCQGNVCTAAKADAVFGAFSSAVWVASTTIQGVQMSRFGRRYESNGESTEQVNDKAMVA
ncbi:uncharacterized protein RSE6_03665 [Rhynchosporium secalis]|uniref:MARVEL domain-containing protein n=1 Tax=Rhynchosporium secalis TaxID=38038 RepID=A0A1E1M3C5_RHYSE|nr:uncharacterized protein RSE6_03665 [Rhynchosporium secalis]